MSDIFEPGWKAPESYWKRIKPTKKGLIAFFALFYLPAIVYQLMMYFLSNGSFNLLWFITPAFFKLIIALMVYHFCYFILKAVFDVIIKISKRWFY